MIERGVDLVSWIGVVESRLYDPRQEGRVQVRIFGYHSGDTSDIEIEDLPWAEVELPTNGGPKVPDLPRGTFVRGYFLDGHSAQKPMVVAVLPGLYTRMPVASLDGKRVVEASKEPKPSDKIIVTGTIVGEPTTGKTLPDIVNLANKNRIHICDIRDEMKKAAAFARLKFSQLIAAIRTAVRAILTALGFSPDGVTARFIEIAKGILRDLKFITKIIKEISDIAVILVFYAKKLRAMIDWLLSLPKNLLALLSNCLSELYSSLASGFSELFSLSGTEGTEAVSSITETMQVFSDIATETKTIVQGTIDIINTPIAIIDALTNPASAADIEKVGTQITSLLAATAAADTSANTALAITNSINKTISV